MAKLIKELLHLQKHPASFQISVNNANNVPRFVKVYIPIFLVLRDQLSQDYICARKAYKAGTSHIHRGCMCSYLHSDNPANKCTPVSSDLLFNLSQESVKYGTHNEEIDNNIQCTMVTLMWMNPGFNRKQQSVWKWHQYIRRQPKLFHK
eukprot:12378737-Ditylum_brightwellii.AAC.1